MKNTLFTILTAFSCLFILHTDVQAKPVKLVSVQNDRYTYEVQSSPDIKYSWKVKNGSIVSGQNTGRVVVKSNLAHLEVEVRETPVFRNLVLRPEDFGAKANGSTDDTHAIQNAIDELKTKGGGILLFGTGKTYVVRKLVVYEGIHLKGSNTLIKRPDQMPNWTHTISTETGATYTTDSKPICISGFIFDGNSSHQGQYKKYELQHAHILFFAAGMKDKRTEQTGRVKAFVENCLFRNGVADGISQYVNSDLTIRNCTAENMFRGGYVCTGGNSVAIVKRFTTKASQVMTGIDIEVDGAGYDNNYAVKIWIDSSVIEDGDFEITLKPGSLVVVSDTKIKNPPVTLDLPGSVILFRNCDINFSSQNSVEGANYILFPTALYFINCRLILKYGANTCIGASLFVRNNSGNEKNKDLYLHFEDCNFTTLNKPQAEKAYGLAFFRDGFTEQHLKIYSRNVHFSADYDQGFAYGFLNKSGYCRSDFQKFTSPDQSRSPASYLDFYANFGKIIND